MLETPPPLSLYVHLPWCVQKCPYCDFNSHTAATDAPFERYTDALLADIEAEAKRAEGRELLSVFIGGGTPSLFPAGAIARIVDRIREGFGTAPDAEITMEANPGTIECGDPAGYLAAGVNRLSIGAQSFSDDSLQRLGRIHSAGDVGHAVTDARAAGFDNINIDLMYALPGQDVRAALADIERALDLEPNHISWYQLTLEPNTVFYARPPVDLPDEDTVADVQERGQALLQHAGFCHYEVSAFARDGRRCVHNLNYWTFGDYLAVGAGAHGKISTNHGVFRYARPANPLAYMQSAEQGRSEPPLRQLSVEDTVFEFMLNALRLTEGFDERLFEARSGGGGDVLRERIARAERDGMIERLSPHRWRPTALGFRFLNDLQAAFLPA